MKLFLSVERGQRRVHWYKIKEKIIISKTKKTVYVVEIWNVLPEDVIEGGSLVTLKMKLDKYMKKSL